MEVTVGNKITQFCNVSARCGIKMRDKTAEQEGNGRIFESMQIEDNGGSEENKNATLQYNKVATIL